jgi:endonuclease/exonuclease/phosphatase family metal-dependent hydrolase
MSSFVRRTALLVALALAACTSLAPPAGNASLRVMTYNIRLDLGSDGADAWPHRKAMVAALIRFHGADLVGVQEALPGQLRDLDAMLPDLRRFGVGRTAERSGEHSAIFYREGRFEVLRHDTFWLSATPSVAGSKGWDAAYERIVTWGEVRDRHTGNVFFHFNTHFDHVGEVARRESARLLLARIEDIAGDAPVLVTGDFNDTPESEPYRLLTAAGLRDAFAASRAPHHGPTSTWNAFRAIEPGRRIDFIFVRGAVDVVRHGILADTVDGRFPSDHLPVIAEVQVGRSSDRRRRPAWRPRC